MLLAFFVEWPLKIEKRIRAAGAGTGMAKDVQIHGLLTILMA